MVLKRKLLFTAVITFSIISILLVSSFASAENSASQNNDGIFEKIADFFKNIFSGGVTGKTIVASGEQCDAWYARYHSDSGWKPEFNLVNGCCQSAPEGTDAADFENFCNYIAIVYNKTGCGVLTCQ